MSSVMSYFFHINLPEFNVVKTTKATYLRIRKRSILATLRIVSKSGKKYIY